MKPCILVVGGTGAFGSRLVGGLLATTDAAVIVAGRRPHRYADLIDTLRQRYGKDRVEAVALDRDEAFGTLQHLKSFCVVDAAGPFQNAEPHLARAAIAAGCHYVDLADARDFVGRFRNLDAAAREAGVLAVTGASSTPALSGAVVSALTEGWRQVDEIAVAISPGNRAPRGLAVVEAILAYAGRPVRVWLDGRWTTKPGWSELVRRDMPGLGRRWLSLCETPDLDLLPARYPSVRTVRFRAGLELSILHLGLWALTLPVRLGLIRSLRPCAAPLQKIASLFERFGTDRGGMSVDVSGVDANGCAIRATWSLVAETGDGPNIPVLPALAILRGLIQNHVQAKGAKIASELLALDVIEQEFKRFRITTRRDVRRPEADSLFERVLGPRVEILPPIVRTIHTHAPVHLLGRARIDGAELVGKAGCPPVRVSGRHAGNRR
ncbi:saccharopine dehydrogenase family protein [Microvirga soli]|uniref:saccharopine dehydrogenase family protein n=1 Tax=Microvirga soli TaxID=1854496 RepID=UPI001FE3F821|nr:saccharopine dehydrogenase NADP-binding domain-containing protein [Microvirga soli]